MKKGSEKMEKNFGTFRKATFGGFNRKDVISYIEKIKNETFEYRCQVEDTIKKLNEKIAELETAVEADAVVTAPAVVRDDFGGEGYTDIKDATQHLKSVADELCNSLGEFIEKLSQRGLCEVDTTSSCKEQPEPVNDVESILSSLAFLNGAKADSKTDDKNTGNCTDVDNILSGLSFLY